MKKIICLILAVSMFFLASCSSEGIGGTDLRYGIYSMDTDENLPAKIHIRPEKYFSIHHGATADTGEFSISGNKLIVDVKDSDCVYVFEINGNELEYVAEESKPSEDFIAFGKITDGTDFILLHKSKGK